MCKAKHLSLLAGALLALSACSNQGLPFDEAKAKVQQAAEAGDVGALKGIARPGDRAWAEQISRLGQQGGFVPISVKPWDVGYDVVYRTICPGGKRVTTTIRFWEPSNELSKPDLNSATNPRYVVGTC
jgi:hypothetical protein